MSAARTERGRTARRPAGTSRSAKLGSRLRSVLVAPRSGFRSTLKAGVAERASSSPLPTFLVLLGGMGALVMLLKVSGLVGLVERSSDETTWGVILPALVLGGIIGIIDYSLWGRFAPRLAGRLGGETDRSKVRLVRAFGDFPLAAYVAIVLPLDLLIVGPEIFATERLEGSFAMVWAALSVALALSATAWSFFLIYRGVEAACRVRGRATLWMIAFGIALYVAVAALFVGLIKLLGVFFG